MIARLKTFALEALHCTVFFAIIIAVLYFGTGCATTPSSQLEDGTSAKVYRVENPYPKGQAAWKTERGTWGIVAPPELLFTGKTATGREIQNWAQSKGINALGLFGDGTYAQLESESAIQYGLWVKAVQRDIGYDYRDDSRDCEDFQSFAISAASLFGHNAPAGAGPLVFGIWAEMRQPFAGVSDGFHALNVIWTDRGFPVFEPQGEDLIYQDIRAWPNKGGIRNFFTQ